MKTREEVAKFINNQLSGKEYVCVRDKRDRVGYGKQELRELMDFIFEGPPAENEIIGRPICVIGK